MVMYFPQGNHLNRLGVIRCCVGVMFIQGPALFMQGQALHCLCRVSVWFFGGRPLESCLLRGGARQHLVLGFVHNNHWQI
jgi:hypothetical protein